MGQSNDVVQLKVMQEIVDKNPLSTQMKSLSKNELRYEHIQIDAVSQRRKESTHKNIFKLSLSLVILRNKEIEEKFSPNRISIGHSYR